MPNCITPEQLDRLVHDRLDEHERSSAVAHVEECVFCQRALERITTTSETDRPSEWYAEPDDRVHLLFERLKSTRPRLLECGPPSRNVFGRESLDRPVVNPNGDHDGNGEGLSQARLPRIEGFQILREVGRGGMGIVYEAEEQKLSRRVALKLLAPGAVHDEQQIERFEREARAAARLHHTNIVPVFGVGRQDGQPYYVMQYIDGLGLNVVISELRHFVSSKSLAQLATAVKPSASTLASFSEITSRTTHGRTDSRRVARIGLQVAEALDYANRHGVLHRDIKPSNLLIDKAGTVWVADFGLAKTVDSDDLTRTGDIVGTIRYMAPERFRGLCDERSDVYSLGLTLYELVALRPAFEDSERNDLIDRVLHNEPARLKNLIPAVAWDLETIIHKAIARDPARRYGTSAALGDDLRRFLAGQPISARRAQWPERAVRWCQRNPWVAAFGVALVLGVVGSTTLAIRATKAQRASRSAEAMARAERDRAVHARDRALYAVRTLLFSDSVQTLGEEMQPYRQELVAAGLEASLALVHELEGDPRADSQLVEAHVALARSQRDAGETDKVIQSIHHAIALAESMVARDPSSVHFKQSLAIALQRVAAITPNVEESLAHTRRSSDILRGLDDRDSPIRHRELVAIIAMNDYNSGHNLFSTNRRREAIEAFQAARTAYAEILRSGDNTPGSRSMLAHILLYLCRAYAPDKNYDDSIAMGRQAIAIYQTLLADDPESLAHANQLNLALQEVGTRIIAAGKVAEAIPYLSDVRKNRKETAARHGRLVSRMVKIQDDLAVADYNLREAYDYDLVRYAGPRREIMEEAFEICDKLGLVQPLSWNLRHVYAQTCFERALYQEEDGKELDLNLLEKSERLWGDLLRENPGNAVARCQSIIVGRELARVLLARGQADVAKKWLGQALAVGHGHPDSLYDSALEYSKRIPGAGLSSVRRDARRFAARRRQLVDDAIDLLGAAVAAGFNNAHQIQTEPKLIVLRADPRFQAVALDLGFPRQPFAS